MGMQDKLSELKIEDKSKKEVCNTCKACSYYKFFKCCGIKEYDKVICGKVLSFSLTCYYSI